MNNINFESFDHFTVAPAAHQGPNDNKFSSFNRARKFADFYHPGLPFVMAFDETGILQAQWTGAEWEAVI